MTKITSVDTAGEGLRERKRRETLQRITDIGIGLFIHKGYEATTLDEIATAAGISRRTFFYYFKSKDEILLSLQSGMGDILAKALKAELQSNQPLIAMRNAIVNVCAPYPTQDMLAMDRLMRSNEIVQARKQATYIQQEKILFETLREHYPEPPREMGLRLVAMAAIGAMRLAFDTMSREGGKRPIDEILHETFDALKSEI